MLCILATATIRGLHLFHPELPRLCTYCSRAVSNRRNMVFLLQLILRGFWILKLSRLVSNKCKQHERVQAVERLLVNQCKFSSALLSSRSLSKLLSLSVFCCIVSTTGLVLTFSKCFLQWLLFRFFYNRKWRYTIRLKFYHDILTPYQSPRESQCVTTVKSG